VVGWLSRPKRVDTAVVAPRNCRPDPRVGPSARGGRRARGERASVLGGVTVTAQSVASHDRGVSVPRRRAPLRSWVVLVLAVLGAVLALFLGGLRSTQSASASSAPNTVIAAPVSAVEAMLVSGGAGEAMTEGQRRSITSASSVGVTQQSPRVAPETSVAGPMRRSGHGALPGAHPQLIAPTLVSGVPADLAVMTTPVLVVLLGGAILVLRGHPIGSVRGL
jgi:hypothetical protein